VAAEIKLDRSKFDATFKEYVKASNRSLPQIINNKLFMIARASLWFTEKASKPKISKSLNKRVKVSVVTASGKTRIKEAPLVALIVHKQQKRLKGAGFRGASRRDEMRAAIAKKIAARELSTAYIKSGWLPSIRELALVSTIKTKKYPDDKAAQQIGKAKGRSVAAKEFTEKPFGMIENVAWAKRDKKNAFMRVGSKGLQAGFDNETKEMQKYIDGKLKPAADKFNAAQR
jgi:hypothetical protein